MRQPSEAVIVRVGWVRRAEPTEGRRRGLQRTRDGKRFVDRHALHAVMKTAEHVADVVSVLEQQLDRRLVGGQTLASQIRRAR